MFHLYGLLLLAFSPFTTMLADPAFWVRERGSRVLAEYWPLSCPAVMAASQSADPEVLLRVRKIAGRDEIQEAMRLWAVCDLVTHTHEEGGLPHADPQRVERYLRMFPDLGYTFVRFADYYKLRQYRHETEGYRLRETLYSEISLSNAAMDLPYLRFRWRGVPGAEKWYYGPYDYDRMRTEWADMRTR